MVNGLMPRTDDIDRIQRLGRLWSKFQHYLLAAILEDQGLHHFDEYLNFGTTKHLILGELSSLCTVYNITNSFNPLQGFWFY